MIRKHSILIFAVSLTLANGAAISLPRSLDAQQSGSPNSTEWQAISRALDKPVSIEGVNRPLGSIVAELSASVRYPIYIDRIGLDDFGMDSNSQFSIQVQNVRLETALDMLLQQDLGWTVHHNMILVTSKERCEEHPIVLTYSLDNLEFGNSSGPYGRRSENTLIDIVETSVEPDSWEMVGGFGSIQYYKPRNVLVVYQSAQTHREIERLLARLRNGPSIVTTSQYSVSPTGRQSQRYQSRRVEQVKPYRGTQTRTVPARLGGGLF